MGKLFASILPYLPYIVGLTGILASFLAPVLLARLNAKTLKSQIAGMQQTIATGKATEAREQATALETLERIAALTSAELEKSLEKSVTLANLKDQLELQRTQIDQQHDIIALQTGKIDQLGTDLAFEHAARLDVEGKMKNLETQLEAERAERQTAVAEITRLKVSSEKVINKLTARVKTLEDYIEANKLPIPNGS